MGTGVLIKNHNDERGRREDDPILLEESFDEVKVHLQNLDRLIILRSKELQRAWKAGSRWPVTREVTVL